MPKIDRNASSPNRIRRNWQRLAVGQADIGIKVTPPLTNGPNGLGINVDGSTILINGSGQLALAHPLTFNETPAGTINGTNPTFTLQNPPLAGTLLLYVDGLLMTVGDDYTLASLTITFLTGAIPQTGDIIRATYET